jgi:hypothetical protein
LKTAINNTWQTIPFAINAVSYFIGEVIMVTKTNTVVQNDTITSLKDGAYKQALAGDRVESIAQYCIVNIKGFPDEVPSEAKEQLYDGYRLRFNERNTASKYARVNDHYLLIDGSNPELNDAKEQVVIGVDYAFSFTQQQFGKMKTDNPYLYPIIKDIRDRCNTYCSNRLGDLKRQARVIVNRGKSKERGATSDFAQRITDVFEDLRVKCDNASKRGDETANKDKFAKAKLAFMTVWNK